MKGSIIRQAGWRAVYGGEDKEETAIPDWREGDTLTLGIGKAGEPYEGIGRGLINIEGLPVYRDSRGGVGTPTSDNERTKIDLNTTHLLVLINGYDGNEESVRANAEFLIRLACDFCEGHDASYYIYR